MSQAWQAVAVANLASNPILRASFAVAAPYQRYFSIQTKRQIKRVLVSDFIDQKLPEIPPLSTVHLSFHFPTHLLDSFSNLRRMGLVSELKS